MSDTLNDTRSGDGAMTGQVRSSLDMIQHKMTASEVKEYH
jgi:hypothetical protein